MRKIEFSIATAYVRSEYKEIVEFDDNATEREIQETYEDWIAENNHGGWHEVSNE